MRHVSYFISFRLFAHVFQNDFRVMIPRVSDGFFPILNRFLRTPLNAGQALFASVKPRRLIIYHLDIFDRTDFQADSTAIAFIVNPEILIQFGNIPKRHLIDPGKQDILPKRSPVHLFSFSPEDSSGNRFHLFLGFPDQPLLSVNWSRTATGDVIGRHGNGTAHGERQFAG